MEKKFFDPVNLHKKSEPVTAFRRDTRTPILGNISKRGHDIMPDMQEVQRISERLGDCFIKFNACRTIPYLFGKEYADLRKEFNVLRDMYVIDQQHIAMPVEIDSNDNYYAVKFYEDFSVFTRTEIIWDSLSECNIKVFEDILVTIKKFHANGLAHGDILNNLLLKLNEEKEVIDWKIIDPVGIDKNDEHFEEAVQKDNADIEMVLSKNHLLEDEMVGDGGTPIRPKINPSIRIERKSITTGIIRESIKKITKLLEEAGIEIDVSDDLFADRKNAKERGETLTQYVVNKIELLADLIEKVTEKIEEDPFCNKEVIISDIVKNLSEKDRLFISQDVLVAAIEKVQRYNRLMINAIRYLEDNPGRGLENYEKNKYSISLVGSAVYIRVKDREAQFPFKEALTEGCGAVAGVEEYKNFPLAIMIVPESSANEKETESSSMSNSIEVFEHEKRHATINKAFFEMKSLTDLLDKEIPIPDADWVNVFLKEEVIAYLSIGRDPKFIRDILSQHKEDGGLYDLRRSNLFNFDDAMYALEKLSVVYEYKKLANILTIMPMEQWGKMAKLAYRAKGMTYLEAAKTPTRTTRQ